MKDLHWDVEKDMILMAAEVGRRRPTLNSHVWSDRKAVEESVATLGAPDTNLPVCKGQKINSD